MLNYAHHLLIIVLWSGGILTLVSRPYFQAGLPIVNDAANYCFYKACCY